MTWATRTHSGFRLIALTPSSEPETSDEVSLGRMYENGASVPQDYATALYWYQLAALARDSAAEAGVERVKQILNR
jgi:TPR repeat protein